MQNKRTDETPKQCDMNPTAASWKPVIETPGFAETDNGDGIPKPLNVIDLNKLEGLGDDERAQLQKVADVYPFHTNSYYLSLINWDDPEDPVRRIIVPNLDELDSGGDPDPSNEAAYTVAPGLEHKYDDTALLLAIDVCGGVCRFCFRKRIFITDDEHTNKDLGAAIEYIKSHKEIHNVLITGGDPLLLKTEKLRKIISEVSQLDHVHAIRIGSKMPSFNPYRILCDPDLLQMIRDYTKPNRKIYFMVHFNHPNELSEKAIEGLNLLQQAGAICCNQTPMIRGVNDSADTLTEHFIKLAGIGIPPYYVFQCRPTIGNDTFAVPIEEGFTVFKTAQNRCSGLAKRARFTMSHETGKIEVVALTDKKIYMKYHRAYKKENYGKLLVATRNPKAYWLDDYTDIEYIDAV